MLSGEGEAFPGVRLARTAYCLRHKAQRVGLFATIRGEYLWENAIEGELLLAAVYRARRIDAAAHVVFGRDA